MTAKRFTYQNTYGWNKDGFLNTMNGLNEKNKKLQKENEQLKSFIQELTTKGTGRIDLADGYSYRVNAVLTNWKGDVE